MCHRLGSRRVDLQRRIPRGHGSRDDDAADLMQDVVDRALAQAIPALVCAGGARWANMPMMSGTDPRSGALWGHMLFNGGSGGGAANGADGWPLFSTDAAHGGLKTARSSRSSCCTRCGSSTGRSPDSMGFGTSAAPASLRVRSLRGDVEVIVANDGLTNPPYGAIGGTAGRGGGHYVTARDGRRLFLPGVALLTLGADESWTGVSTGGGGYGDPRDDRRAGPCRRARRAVRAWPRRRGFRRRPLDGADHAVDEAATAARRAEIERARGGVPLAVVLPITPAASTWLPSDARRRRRPPRSATRRPSAPDSPGPSASTSAARSPTSPCVGSDGRERLWKEDSTPGRLRCARSSAGLAAVAEQLGLSRSASCSADTELFVHGTTSRRTR